MDNKEEIIEALGKLKVEFPIPILRSERDFKKALDQKLIDYQKFIGCHFSNFINEDVSSKISSLIEGIRKSVDYFLNNYFEVHFFKNELTAYLITFPLIISSLFKVLTPNSKFIPEYIVSQILMSYVRVSGKFHGVMYPSTKVGAINGINGHYNYAFPAKSSKPSGYCERLLEMFEWTPPQLLPISEINNGLKIPEEVQKRHSEIKIMMDANSETPYSKSPQAEDELRLFNSEILDTYQKLIEMWKEPFNRS